MAANLSKEEQRISMLEEEYFIIARNLKPTEADIRYANDLISLFKRE